MGIEQEDDGKDFQDVYTHAEVDLYLFTTGKGGDEG